MPYIAPTLRKILDPAIENLVLNIQAAVHEEYKVSVGVAGLLNYTVSRILVKTLPEKRYWALALGIGTLVCTILEFYRRYVSKFEDTAIDRNGDIPEYE